MDYLIHIIQTAGYWGYGILFLIIFLESFPLTFFFPGDSLLFTTGFLASAGHFNIMLLILTLLTASFFGYIFSYVMGKKLRNFILRSNDRYWFKKRHLDYTEDFYKKYGNKTILFSRFIPVVRSFAPILAGAGEVPRNRFLIFSTIGALLWTCGITSLGFFLGSQFPETHLYLTPIILAIIFVSLLPGIIEYIRSKRKTS
ncbi:MAG: VTT domain-containing protein [Candidatus Zambryskibacteria bacterium]|nr:VTT domain-containing protein [Candidatus Zambryskibacteria bacterium]